ncbi:hypothetical protein [Rathayibacter soli]|uniref:hypothetical protein n=1 Tax=Rathayibacter soli TaxID=3144168 RepID=UPI0027E4B20D|nr:hypothetical protein [Glaciibacter superstes]
MRKDDPIVSAAIGPAGLTTAVVTVCAVAAVPLSFAGPGWLRLAVVGPFLLAGPGAALALFLWTAKPDEPRRPQRWLPFAVTVAIGSSLAASVLIATAMIYTHLWYPSLAVCLLSAITLAIVTVPARRLRWPELLIRWESMTRASALRAQRWVARHAVPGSPGTRSGSGSGTGSGSGPGSGSGKGS